MSHLHTFQESNKRGTNAAFYEECFMEDTATEGDQNEGELGQVKVRSLRK